jgi:hypothetical protein
MNKEIVKQMAKKHGAVLGSQILGLIGQALINFAKEFSQPKATLNVATPEQFVKEKPSAGFTSEDLDRL